MFRDGAYVLLSLLHSAPRKPNVSANKLPDLNSLPFIASTISRSNSCTKLSCTIGEGDHNYRCPSTKPDESLGSSCVNPSTKPDESLGSSCVDRPTNNLSISADTAGLEGDGSVGKSTEVIRRSSDNFLINESGDSDPANVYREDDDDANKDLCEPIRAVNNIKITDNEAHNSVNGSPISDTTESNLKIPISTSLPPSQLIVISKQHNNSGEFCIQNVNSVHINSTLEPQIIPNNKSRILNTNEVPLTSSRSISNIAKYFCQMNLFCSRNIPEDTSINNKRTSMKDNFGVTTVQILEENNGKRDINSHKTVQPSLSHPLQQSSVSSCCRS